MLSDAPASYIDVMLRGIVGFRFPITRLEGKWKMSQNRDMKDQDGVAKGLRERGDSDDLDIAEIVLSPHAEQLKHGAYAALGSGYRGNDLLCAYDGTGVVRHVDIERGVHHLIRVIRRCVLHHGDIITELGGIANVASMQVCAISPMTISLWMPCFLSCKSKSVLAKPLEHQCSCATISPGAGTNSAR